MIEMVFFLICAHYFADYVLQSDYLANTKKDSWYNLFAHCIIYTGATMVVFKILGVFNIIKALIMLVSHIIIDKWKCTKPPKLKYLYIDQSLHLLIIITLAFL